MTQRSARSEWAQGWPLVASGCLGMTLANMHAGALGVIMQPLQAQFGWTRAQISASMLIVCAGILVLSPLLGLVIDRLGSRRVALTGIPLTAIAITGVALSGPGIGSWYAAWVLVALVYPTTSAVVWTLGVGRCFDKQRGMAFALTIAGIGIGAFLSPLLAVALLPHIGWRGVFMTLALGGLLGWPVIWWLFNPDRIAREQTPADRPAPPLTGYGLPLILRNWRYWTLVLVTALLAATVGGITLHFQPILRDAGMTPGKAAEYASLMGPAAIVGHLVAGRLLDRFAARFVGAAFFATPAVACLVLLHFHGAPSQALLAAGILGLAQGIEGDVIAYLVARYFGLKRYGVSYGLMVGVFSFSYGLSPVIAGAVFDASGSYAAMLKLLGVGTLVASVLTMILGRAPAFAAAAEAEAPPLDAVSA